MTVIRRYIYVTQELEDEANRIAFLLKSSLAAVYLSVIDLGLEEINKVIKEHGAEVVIKKMEEIEEKAK